MEHVHQIISVVVEVVKVILNIHDFTHKNKLYKKNINIFILLKRQQPQY